jgi:hypothetical protein
LTHVVYPSNSFFIAYDYHEIPPYLFDVSIVSYYVRLRDNITESIS